MTDIAIFGASGYGGQELLRYLATHPQIRVAAAVSGRWAGRTVAEALPHLEGFHEGLRFTAPDQPLPSSCAGVFLAVPHGTARDMVPRVEGLKIVDLSMDFRDESDGFVYGLTESNRNRIREADRVANPGCFATGALLALAPLASIGALAGDVVLSQTTGSSGSGAHAKAGTHHPERAQDMRAYKVLSHQHRAEIEDDVGRMGAGPCAVSMVPQSGPFARGIFTAAHVRLDPRLDSETDSDTDPEFDPFAIFAKHYADEPFVRMRPDTPTLRRVARTNYAEVSLHVADGRAVILSTIDNLGKGMAGQAIQNMNLLLGLDETMGLKTPGANA